jgi:hypothetical protein
VDGSQWLVGLLDKGTPPPEPEPVTWRDLLDQVREDYGRGATRHLADTLGVTQRTAQRYMTGQHTPYRHAVRDLMAEEITAAQERKAEQYRAELDQWYQDRRDELAAFVELINVVRPRSGVVVGSKSNFATPLSKRSMDFGVRVDMTDVAQAIRDDDIDGAADLLSDQIIAAYGGSGTGLAEILHIVDYPGGLDYA